MDKEKLVDKLTPSDALAILKELANSDSDILLKIEEIAKKHLSDIDLDEIAEEVFSELDRLYVEDLWDSSGATSFGYIEPHERAYEMFEETIEPFIDEMKKYRNTKMFQEERIYCMGILKGIYKYEIEAKSEFKDWAADVPKTIFSDVLYEWKKEQKNKNVIKEMDEFVKDSFVGWG